MDTSKYRALRPEALRDIELRRLGELESAHYRLALDVEDAAAQGDVNALEQMMPALTSLGSRVHRAQTALGLVDDEPVVEAD